MELFKSKCDNCGSTGYIFPDQIEDIKRNDNLALHKYCKEKLHIGSKWLCVKCDSSNKNGHNCKISDHLTGDKAKKLIDIRRRESNLKSMGFVLPGSIK